MGENRLRRCAHCGQPFTPDARNAHHQRYCPAPACRLASKRASQNKWLAKPENRDYHRGPAAVARVQAWRRAHPGYSRRPTGAPVTAVPVPAAAASAVPPLTEPPTATTTTAPADPLTKTAGNAPLIAPPAALQEPCPPPLQEISPAPLQDLFAGQPTIFIGLIAHLWDLALQEDIAATLDRLLQLGRDIRGGYDEHDQTGAEPGAPAPGPGALQLARSPPGPGALPGTG